MKKRRREEGSNKDKNFKKINPKKFFKIILPKILQSKTLSIPDAFAKEFNLQLPTNARLTIRTGLSWKIALEQVDNKLCFTKGWANFMEQNAVEYGYFLEFEYQGNKRFKVYIFDLSCSEIDYPTKYDQYAKQKFPQNVKEKVVEDDEDEAEKDIHRGGKVLERNSNRPSFTITVQQSHISIKGKYCYMQFPRGFSSQHMEKSYESIMLQTGDGREWHVACYVYKQLIRLHGKSWRKFMKENHWDEHKGEEYTFVLVDKKSSSVTFKVIKE
ncbi:putative B3 domain-containing protein Os03g0621600 [Chenopodium quinoa]|uniref:putative B3 domain-containing protein Os03g0621600 n=1 Tax=Chenopodium quinoa TaxID=63459 RepID=UPI000B7870B1|nr:putative B3 domain-containing protein Os03g0621600 [Chenopodium quinoa]